MTRPWLVLESTTDPRDLGGWAGIRWQATRYAVLSPLSWFLLGVMVAAVSGGTAVPDGLAYSLALLVANWTHTAGHILAGKLGRSPVHRVLLTATRDVIEYVRQGSSAPPRERVLRSLGGPLANAALGGAALVLSRAADTIWAEAVAMVNLALAVWTLIPFPTMDGSAVLAAVRVMRRHAGER